jgi:hypothetical protein
MSNSAESQEIQLTSMAPDIIRVYVILSRRSVCVTKATCGREEQVDGPDHHKWVIYFDAINLACKVKGWKAGPYCSIIAKIVMNKLTSYSNNRCGKCYWHMSTSDPSTFRFLKISKPNTSIFRKIMILNI